MSLKTMTLEAGDASASTLTVNTPSDLIFSSTGVTIPNGVQCVVPAISSAVRPVLTAKFRPSVIRADGTRSKNKWILTYAVPKLVENDSRVEYEVYRQERELHPETTADEGNDKFNIVAAQLAINSAMAAFWSVGSFD